MAKVKTRLKARPAVVIPVWILALLIQCCLLAGCGSTGYLSAPEDALGVGTLPVFGTNLRVYHAALLDPAGIGLRSPGYLIGVEKIHRAEGTHRTVTHVIRYAEREPPCVLQALLEPSAAGRTEDPLDLGVYTRCADWAGIPYSTELARAALTRDLASGKYTHVLLMIMGWNTEQEKSVKNFNAIATNLTVEAKRRVGGARAFNPLIIGITWPSQWSLDDWSAVPAPLVRAVSFVAKKNQAAEIGATIVMPLIEKAILPARAAARSAIPVIMLGHSFGARALAAGFASPGPRRATFNDRDRLILLQGAFELPVLFDETAPGDKKPMVPRLGETPLRVVMTASAHDSAVGAAVWGWYAGDVDTLHTACGIPDGRSHLTRLSGLDQLDFSAFGCARAVKAGAWGLGLCHAGPPSLTAEHLPAGRRIEYYDASWLINCPSSFSGGHAHSDIFRREMARFLLDRIGG